MPALGPDARLLSNDQLARWLIEDFPYRIQLAPVFPFYPVHGDRLRYASTPALPPAAAIDFSSPIPEDTKHPIDPNREFPLAEIATHFRVSYRAQDIFSSAGNDQTAVQAALAIRELLYRFWILFESGAGSPAGFRGLAALASRSIDAACRPLTLELLQQAKELVRANDGRGIVLFTNSTGKQAIHAAYWTRGLSPPYCDMSFPSPQGGSRSEKVLLFDGAPVYVSDLNQHFRCDAHTPSPTVTPIPREETLTLHDHHGLAAHIYFFVMGHNCLHGIVPASLGSSMFVTRSTLLPDGSALVYHVTFPVGIALGSEAALAVLRNVTIPHA